MSEEWNFVENKEGLYTEEQKVPGGKIVRSRIRNPGGAESVALCFVPDPAYWAKIIAKAIETQK